MAKKPYPELGVPFELTLDGDAPENQPLAMVKNYYGYNNPGGWEHRGPTVKGKETRRFMLVSVGYCADWRTLTEKLAAYGLTPEGQWLEAFRAEYPEHDGKEPVGVHDASWVNPLGGASFPCVLSVGLSGFHWTGGGFYTGWRWLVPAK